MAMLGGFLLIFGIIILAIVIVIIVSMWKIFDKAGQPGWAAIVPFYNIFIFTQIIRKPGWWVILMLIPYIGIVWNIWATNLLSKVFGKDTGFTVGMIFLPFIFMPILAFGDAKYMDGEKPSIPGVLDSGIN